MSDHSNEAPDNALRALSSAYFQPYTTLPLLDELRGSRILVRPYRLEDATALKAAVDESREHVRPWLPFADAHQTVEEARDWIAHGIAKDLRHEVASLSIWDLATGHYLGGIDLHVRDWAIRSFEIGYWVRASAQGHGYVSEAVRLVADFAFDIWGAQRVMIRCDARNDRSAAVARRLGFLQEAHVRCEARATDGTLRDTLIFALIPSDPRWPRS